MYMSSCRWTICLPAHESLRANKYRGLSLAAFSCQIQEVQGMQKQLTKIPSALRKLDLSSVVEVSEHITPEEGAIILVEALADSGKNNLLEYTSGRIGFLVEGDIIPAVLGKRRALREYSGDIPSQLASGDILYF